MARRKSNIRLKRRTRGRGTKGAIPLVYLDQNKWIELARVIHRGDLVDARLAAAAMKISESSRTGHVLFPLSGTHYYETAKNRNIRSRTRLGEVLWEVSRRNTIAAHDVVVTHELHQALQKLFPGRVQAPRFKLLGKGIGHAIGAELSVTAAKLPGWSASDVKITEAQIEKSMLTGQNIFGETLPTIDLSKYGVTFRQRIEALRSNLENVPPRLREGTMFMVELLDVWELLNRVLQQHSITFDEVKSLGLDGIKRFVMSMPTRHVSYHLHRQYLKNPALQPKINDLQDWNSLSIAVMYCDLVVCEKHFASLIERDGFRTKATVLVDLRELPAALVVSRSPFRTA